MPTRFEEEIRSQADILRRRAESGKAAAQIVAESWADIMYVVVGARGSSDNAARFFQYLAGQQLNLLVALAAPSLYEGDGNIEMSGSGVLLISQSGRSPGITDILRQARAQHRPSAAMTNDRNSPLAQQADHLIDLAAGDERALASSKTFSASWQALAQLVEALMGRTLEGLEELPDVVERVTHWALSSVFPLQLLNPPKGLTVVGRGIGFSVASEISIKIREVAGIRSESYAASDFVHGPIGADGAGSTLLLVVTEEMTDDICELVLEGSRESGMRTVLIRPHHRRPMSCDEEIVLNESTPNWSLGLAMTVVGQVLALRLGELLHRPVDTSPGLHKITTAV
jgi:glucosamine--fructose-6-phosphate aminotransferase (isomerizing)